MQHNRRLIFTVIILMVAAVQLCGCVQVTVLPDSSPAPEPTPVASVAPAAETAQPTDALPTPTEALPTPTEAPVTAAPSPTPSNPPMYSSLAHLVSFDPASGVAHFDYFDMLRGDDAVDFLVSHEGYSEADAQALVDEFADSEFVEKNTNSQLRAIDLDDTPLKMMIRPSGEPVDGAESIPSSAADVRAIYAVDPALLSMYFYSIHVESDGRISLVEQLYWP